MKSIKEIMVRAIILVCISDRCALEEKVIEGKRYTISERERQRNAIRNWLYSTGYIDYATKSERELFDASLDEYTRDDISHHQFQYEAVEPCLWSLGLVNKLSNYEQLVLEDFHPVLQIGMTHTYKKVIGKCVLREQKEIELQTEIAMLWHWRAIEAYNPIFIDENIGNIVNKVFGQRYFEILSQIKCVDVKNDFIIRNCTFSSLSDEEKSYIKIISFWRHYAFEWIIGNNSWDEVDVDT